jgi:tetratricopeptide (TPR) repeat protein
MAKISLRAYNREIAEMIDHGKTNEAIAHCQFILQTYPKHIETYRLLGKAYLESQRYAEAADIFQRILSVIPDDFITHVGMSIVRGDEGNLDASIWHMERAFEIQPSNAAIQDELRHLYGRRDGTEPAKIRLTRGALVRMYARGNLFSQAVAEIKAALQETPQRPDLEVLLTKMYFASNMKTEAATTCANLLSKYPYCIDANRINTQILTAAGKLAEAASFRQRVVACDPYEAFLSQSISNIADVPDDSIQVDHLDISVAEKSTLAHNLKTPSTAEFSKIDEKLPAFTPAWLTSEKEDEIILPGAEEETQTKELESTDAENPSDRPGYDELPDWLNNIETQEPIAKTTAAPVEESIKPAEGSSEIPDWMKASGWGPSNGETQESSQPVDFSTPAESEEAIEPGQIPDWLKPLAPAESSAEAGQSEKPVDFSSMPENPQFMEGSAPSMDFSSMSMPSEPVLPEESAPSVPPVETSSGAVANQDVELPDWLKEISSNQPSAEASIPAPDLDHTMSESVWVEEQKSAVLPDINIEQAQIKEDFNPNTFGLTGSLPTELPDWLKAAAAEDEKKEDEILGDTTPLHLNDQEEPEAQVAQESQPVEEPQAAPSEPSPVVSEEHGLSDWFKQLETEEHPGVEEPVASSQEENVPDWLSEIEQMPSASTNHEPEITPISQIEPPPVIPVPSEETRFTPPVGIKTPEPPDTSILPKTPEATAEEMPEWLRGLESIPEENGTGSVQPPVERSFEDQFASVPPAEPSGDLPDWLKPMAPVSSVDELQASLEKSNEESGEVPDWLRKVADEEMSKERTPTTELPGNVVPAANAEFFAEQPVQDLPDFLKSLVEKPAENQTTMLDESMLYAAGLEEPLKPVVELIEPVEEPAETLESEFPAEEPVLEEYRPESVSPAAEAELSGIESAAEAQIPAEEPQKPQTAEFPVVPEPDRFANEAESILPPLVQTSYLHDPYETEEVILPPQEEYLEPVKETAAQPVSPYANYSVEQFETDEAYTSGRTALLSGDFATAQSQYLHLIQEKKYLDGIIADLISVEKKFDDQPDYWELLGDAHGKSSHLQAALDAYTKAEDAL